jgi:hypothetical protein
MQGAEEEETGVDKHVDHERARALADELLAANQLDERTDYLGTYATGEAGVHEVDYADSRLGGRYVVTVWLEDGRAELQRQ